MTGMARRSTGNLSAQGLVLSQIPSHEPTAQEIDRAAITVCANATDVNDALELLKMLGLFYKAE